MSILNKQQLEQEAANIQTDPQRLDQLAYSPVARNIIAQNISTPPYTLRRMIQSYKNTRAVVAENPNISFELILELLPEYPNQIIENPAFDFYLIENPTLLEKFNSVLLWKIINNANLPRVFLSEAMRSSDEFLRIEAQMHINATNTIDVNWRAAMVRIIAKEFPKDFVKEQLFMLPSFFNTEFLQTLSERPGFKRLVAFSAKQLRNPANTMATIQNDTSTLPAEMTFETLKTKFQVSFSEDDLQAVVMNEYCTETLRGELYTQYLINWLNNSKNLEKYWVCLLGCCTSPMLWENHLNIHDEALQTNALNWFWNLNAAMNPQTSEAVLLELLQNSNRFVRAAASETIKNNAR